MKRFDATVKPFVTASESGDIGTMREPFRNVGQACSSCHDGFRLPE
jgi:cytochrome c556